MSKPLSFAATITHLCIWVDDFVEEVADRLLQFPVTLQGEWLARLKTNQKHGLYLFVEWAVVAL